mmetsp:Transcript_11000/g.23059  ORF Transcript_11000/g.23059 Transcript_11000/m.23059 type:complete len:153 (+) Transcript_11000:141-599(+)
MSHNLKPFDPNTRQSSYLEMEDPEGTQHIDDVDIESSRSSERTHSTIPVGVNASFSNTDFYRPSLRRQNRFFGGGVVIIAAAFVAAYFLMDMSFTPSNVRTFGDESHFEGGSGERYLCWIHINDLVLTRYVHSMLDAASLCRANNNFSKHLS